MGRVQFHFEEEERSSKTSLLPLTAIIKPPSDKGGENLKEIKEERRIDNPEQALILGNTVRREERQSSPSFDWMHEPQIEVYHNEQIESSR